LDVVKFEARVTEALEIQEGVEKMENQEIIEGSSKAARKKRYMMMGLATLGDFNYSNKDVQQVLMNLPRIRTQAVVWLSDFLLDFLRL
jgi:hypothetical protein